MLCHVKKVQSFVQQGFITHRLINIVSTLTFIHLKTVKLPGAAHMFFPDFL